MSNINVSSKSKSSSSSSSSSNDIKECENKFCKSYFPSSMQNIITGINKEFEKRFTHKMSADKKKEYFKKEKELANKKKTVKEIKEEARNEKKSFNDCMSLYCNKGCKNTIYEDGDKFSDELEAYQRNDLKKTFKNNKKLINMIIDGSKEQRALLFKKKTSVLNDNFYNKTSKKTLKILKRKKAISACTKDDIWKTFGYKI